jgi:hypothetical protein
MDDEHYIKIHMKNTYTWTTNFIYVKQVRDRKAVALHKKWN